MKIIPLTIGFVLSLCGCAEIVREPEAECAVAAPVWPVPPPKRTDPDTEKWVGFRGLRWGVNIKDVNDPNVVLIYDNAKRRVTYYRRQDEKLSIGNADLSDVVYLCYKDRFFGVEITTDGAANFLYLRDAVFAHYGEGYKPDLLEDKWLWNWLVGVPVSDVTMTLAYDQISETTRFTLYYQPIRKEQSADNAKTAAEARSDF